MNTGVATTQVDLVAAKVNFVIVKVVPMATWVDLART